MKKFLLSAAGFAARLLPDRLKQAIYKFRPLARLLRRTLNEAAPEGRAIVKVAAGGLAGARLELDLHIEKDYWLGTYEADLQKALKRFVKPGMTAYDIGANIGYISLLLARAVGENGQVVAVEALPVNQERLRRNLALNDLEGKVQVISAAVVDRPGPVTFLVHSSTSMGKALGSAGREEEDYRQRIQVEGVSLDDLIYKRGLPLPGAVKMDIEGGEALAVRGMTRLLREAPPIFLIELHGHAAGEVVADTLRAAGYTFLRMAPGYPVLPAAEELDWKAYLVALPPTSQKKG